MNNIILYAREFSIFCSFIHILNYVIHDVLFFHELSICYSQIPSCQIYCRNSSALYLLDIQQTNTIMTLHQTCQLTALIQKRDNPICGYDLN